MSRLLKIKLTNSMGKLLTNSWQMDDKRMEVWRAERRKKYWEKRHEKFSVTSRRDVLCPRAPARARRPHRSSQRLQIKSNSLNRNLHKIHQNVELGCTNTSERVRAVIRGRACDSCEAFISSTDFIIRYEIEEWVRTLLPASRSWRPSQYSSIASCLTALNCKVITA